MLPAAALPPPSPRPLRSDFQLQLAAGGAGSRAIGPAQYLEDVLADVRAGGGPDEANRNQVHAMGVGVGAGAPGVSRSRSMA